MRRCARSRGLPLRSSAASQSATRCDEIPPHRFAPAKLRHSTTPASSRAAACSIPLARGRGRTPPSDSASLALPWRRLRDLVDSAFRITADRFPRHTVRRPHRPQLRGWRERGAHRPTRAAFSVYRMRSEGTFAARSSSCVRAVGSCRAFAEGNDLIVSRPGWASRIARPVSGPRRSSRTGGRHLCETPRRAIAMDSSAATPTCAASLHCFVIRRAKGDPREPSSPFPSHSLSQSLSLSSPVCPSPSPVRLVGRCIHQRGRPGAVRTLLPRPSRRREFLVGCRDLELRKCIQIDPRFSPTVRPAAEGHPRAAFSPSSWPSAAPVASSNPPPPTQPARNERGGSRESPRMRSVSAFPRLGLVRALPPRSRCRSASAPRKA